jgi:hypothetical protein
MNKDSNYTRVCVWGQCGKHCSKDGKTDCTQAQTYGQLQELVEEGFECPLGHFGKELVELHPLHANWRYYMLIGVTIKMVKYILLVMIQKGVLIIRKKKLLIQ